MGLCSSDSLSAEEKERRREEKLASKKIEEQNQQEMVSEQAVKKLLLLGAGESGRIHNEMAMAMGFGDGICILSRCSM